MRLAYIYSKVEVTTHGVRRIPISTRSLTGEVGGKEFESSLERDLLMLMHWDCKVDTFQTQPVRIEYNDRDGKLRRYTPDLLIKFHQLKGRNSVPARPILCEVKYRADLIAMISELRPKFRAARHYAKEKGWKFMIATEREIRTPYLENVRFLWRYREARWDIGHGTRIKQALCASGEISIRDLLAATYVSERMRAEAIWTLWCLVARKEINCDLSAPLNINSVVWIEG
jgi:hypothetical protein